MAYMTKLGLASVAVGALLAACGSQPAATQSSQPAASSSPTATALNCKLPVAPASLGSAPTPRAGFIALPSGNFTLDPSSGISYDAGSRRYRTTQSPVLFGDLSGITYDSAYHRWLPVTPSQMLPDGSTYVYTREASPTPFRNEVHVVNVATGTDRIVYDQGAYHPVAYQPDGIYLDHHLNGTDASNGLWLLDPSAGTLKAYPSGARASWARIAAGGAWTYSVDGSRFGSSSFARLDLSAGTMTTWFQVASPAQPPQPGAKTVRVFGFDGSQPLVQVYVDEHPSEIWRVTAPGQATRLPDLPLGPLSPPMSVADSHGTWLLSPDSVYLYANASFQRMAAAPANAGGSYAVAGGCS